MGTRTAIPFITSASEQNQSSGPLMRKIVLGAARQFKKTSTCSDMVILGETARGNSKRHSSMGSETMSKRRSGHMPLVTR